jgi:hypothetical protein
MPIRREVPSSREDLLAEQTSPGANSVLVGLSDVMVQAGSHLATYYSSDAGRLRMAGPFLTEGIVLGQPCFLIASGKPLAQYIEFLEQNVKAELAEARHRGLFQTAPTLGHTVEEALTFWNERLSAVNGSGPPIVRIVGEMASVKANFESMDEMLVFERRVGSILKQFPTVAICQYDVREFDGTSLLEAIKAHPDVFDLGFTKFVS